MIRIRRILVPTDFSPSARHAMLYGTSFAHEYGAEVLLLHVVEIVPLSFGSELFPSPAANVVGEIAELAATELKAAADGVRATGVPVRESVTTGRPSAEIVRAAIAEMADMIVLGTHGKGALDHALFGSTAERVVRKAPCPVLTVRLQEREFVAEV